MTRRENTNNNLDQYFVLDIRHTIYGSIIGMSLCGFSHNKLKNYVVSVVYICQFNQISDIINIGKISKSLF